MKKKISKAKETAKRLKLARAVRLVLAFYILAMLILQLFTFEDFPHTISLLGASGAGLYAVAIVLVLLELMSLPFLIGLKTKDAVLSISFACGIATMLVLTVLEILAFSAGQTVIFGATFALPGGSWSLLFLAAMWVLVVWSACYLLNGKYKGYVKK